MNHKLITVINEALDLNLEASAILLDNEISALARSVNEQQERLRAELDRMDGAEDAIEAELFKRCARARGELGQQAQVIELANKTACEILRGPKAA